MTETTREAGQGYYRRHYACTLEGADVATGGSVPPTGELAEVQVCHARSW